jgi:hypothetical protein
MTPFYRIAFASLFLSVPFILSGCADDNAPAKVTGTITLDGSPVAGAEVTFTPDDGTRISQGTTDNAGKYELWFSATAAGAAVGTHKVSIRSTSSDEYIPHPESNEPPPATETIPKRYNSETELSATVKSGRNTVNFELTSN